MKDQVADDHGRVVENLLDGVMVVERGGTITVFNAPAADIPRITRDEVLGKSFAELFIPQVELEEFTELVLNTAAGKAEDGRQVVTLDPGDSAFAIRGNVLHQADRWRGFDAGGADCGVQRNHRAKGISPESPLNTCPRSKTIEQRAAASHDDIELELVTLEGPEPKRAHQHRHRHQGICRGQGCEEGRNTRSDPASSGAGTVSPTHGGSRSRNNADPAGTIRRNHQE